MLKLALGRHKGIQQHSWRTVKKKFTSSSSSTTQTTTASGVGVPREIVDCVVIGAGVVGIAVARELALKGRDVLVVESAPTFGTGTSSRNSEVIHAGIYYLPNSLKVSLSLSLKSFRLTGSFPFPLLHSVSIVIFY